MNTRISEFKKMLGNATGDIDSYQVATWFKEMSQELDEKNKNIGDK